MRGDDRGTSLVGNDGADQIFGGVGNDTLSGGFGDDFLDAGNGFDDSLFEFADVDFTLTDSLLFGVGVDSLVGIENATLMLFNSLTPRPLSINAAGFGGKTVLVGNEADNVMIGGSGADVMNALGGNDTMQGNNGDDTQFGGSGADTFMTSLGNDQYFGDDGFDTLDFQLASNGVQVSLLSRVAFGDGTDLIDALDVVI